MMLFKIALLFMIVNRHTFLKWAPQSGFPTEVTREKKQQYSVSNQSFREHGKKNGINHTSIIKTTTLYCENVENKTGKSWQEK